MREKVFKFFAKLKRDENIKKSVKDFSNLWETDFDDIWNIENENNLLIALNGWLCKKSNYGDNIEKLSAAERVFYIIFQLEGEVNNGGFSQYFHNSNGNFANEVAKALREIGADETADICDTALAALGGEIPVEWALRQETLESVITDSVDKILSECDGAFYKYPDDLEELNYQYILNNKAQFTR